MFIEIIAFIWIIVCVIIQVILYTHIFKDITTVQDILLYGSVILFTQLVRNIAYIFFMNGLSKFSILTLPKLFV